MNPQRPHGGAAFDRERDRDPRERDLDDQRHRPLPQDDVTNRDRDRDLDRDREHADRQPREPYQPGAPLHSTAGSIPIHQPVASRISGVIHSPGGLLGAHNGPSGALPLGAPTTQLAGFGGPIHSEPGRPMPQGPNQNGVPAQQHQMFAPIPQPTAPNGAIGAGGSPRSVFGGPLQPDNGRGPGQGPPPPTIVPPAQTGSAAGLSQGQGSQPILNDALSYLDQVKAQFHEQPDVYNRFLDIMKDFKSQTIDTPGVINRVSDLFAGHPNLIQGFNTFLPPGYRIECGLDNNPNSIRVTTPSGSTVHSIGAGRGALPPVDGPGGPPGQAGQFLGPNSRPGNWQQPLQHSIESPEAHFSAPAQPGPGPFGPGTAPGGQFDGHSPAHQQRIVGPGQVVGGPSSGLVPGPPSAMPASAARNAQTPTPGGQQLPLNGATPQQGGQRGPVEFNHAISYVNKIKNRFQDKPEIYKQFLEILQTYQREQKPIQEVYAQVTTLFHTAPDLLEDFKQFLPESAAQTRTFGQRPGEDGGLLNHINQMPQAAHAARDGPKMPPVGNFAVPVPASASKDKKRPRADKQVPVATPQAQQSPAIGPASISGAKRPKISHKPNADGPAFEPSLTPVVPEPIAPSMSANFTQEKALAYLERIKKHIGNRTTLHEFLKLINLYTQGLIDKNVLVHKAQMIIGANVELMSWFKDFVRYTGDDEMVENKPEPPTGRVSLSNCRGYGPSYRLLPKRERLKPCSGRDELCNSVLNDEWASHPTWASEDSGFVAHRKNAFEEGLHRIEEERHDYDFFIEANQKCIQLLEPIAQQMLTLSPAERQNFRMPVGLGGQSTSIYKRVLKKVYGADKGAEVVNDMFQHPFTVVPIVMARLKQKDEEWRFSQREWEKVWQSQTKAMHLKSLDHQGIQVKGNDKRTLSAKHLVDLIKTKHEEQKRQRINKGKAPRYQYMWSFEDQGVLLDLLRFMVLYAMNSGQHGSSEKERILEFFESAVPHFFGIQPEQVRHHLGDIDRDAGEEEVDDNTPAELTNGRSRRNGKKSDLLRGLLDPGRNGSKTRSQNEDSNTSASKETTPDQGSANEEEMADAPEDGSGSAETSNERWLVNPPKVTVLSGRNPLRDSDSELRADASFPRLWYNFFCNQTIFVFFSVFQTLYKRLKTVKESKESVLEEIMRERADKPAKQLGLVHDEMNYFEGDPETFWPRTVELIEDFITGEIDESRYQDVLRHYYLQCGWTLYTIQDLLKTLCRQALVCNNSDSKEKTPDLVQQFLTARSQEETSYQAEISSRKFAEKCIKDGEMFMITWAPKSNEAMVRWLPREDSTFHTEEMDPTERWKYYIASYMRVDPTEGVPKSRLQKSLLARNLPSSDSDSDDGAIPKPLSYHEGLTLRICINSSKIVYEKETSEYAVYNLTALDEERRAFDRDRRAQLFREKMVMNNAWMKDLSQVEVQGSNEDFRRWVNDGVIPGSAALASGGDASG